MQVVVAERVHGHAQSNAGSGASVQQAPVAINILPQSERVEFVCWANFYAPAHVGENVQDLFGVTRERPSMEAPWIVARHGRGRVKVAGTGVCPQKI